MKTLNPVWNESLALPLKSTTEVRIDVFDWDRVGKNDLCGSAFVFLPNYYMDLMQGTWIDLDVNLDTQGMVRLKMQFNDEHSLFGLNLDNACLREKSEVPRIVTLCIAALESEGGKFLKIGVVNSKLLSI